MKLRRAAVAAAFAALPALAHAQTVAGGTDPSTIISNLANFILGPFGQSLAVLAIIAVGFAFMFGRLGIFMLAGVVGGLILIFGSSFLVTQIVG